MRPFRCGITYNRPAPPDLGYVVIHARLKDRNGFPLTRLTDIVDPVGHRVARAMA